MSDERANISSFFTWPDKPIREPDYAEAIPYQIKWKCGRCGVVINHDFDKDDLARCLNGHTNQRPEAIRPFWRGTK